MEDRNEMQPTYSKSIKAGRRTYFFDVREMRTGDFYLTITESKKKFGNDDGRVFYEKHKIYLYKEDFEKFMNGLNDTIDYIKDHQEVVEKYSDSNEE